MKTRSRRWLIAGSALSIIAGGYLAMPAGANTTVVHPSGDAYVSSLKSNQNKNFGSSTNLRFSDSSSNVRRTYVQYNVPALFNIKGARIYPKVKGTAPFEVHLTDAFNEKNITYVNAPKVGDLIATVKPTKRGTVSVDVSQAIGSNTSARTVAFVIVSKGGLGSFVSREAKENHPVDLVVDTGPNGTLAPTVPVTSTMATVPPTTATTVRSTTSTTKAAQPVTTTTAAPISGTQPTRANTGPRYSLTGSITPAQFLASRTCNRQAITGTITLDKRAYAGQTFNLTDCEVQGGIESRYLSADGKSPLPISEMPVFNVNYTRITGGMYTYSWLNMTMDHSSVGGKLQLSAQTDWNTGLRAPAPFNITNSFLYDPLPPAPTHMEVLQTGSMADGMHFSNVAFVQGGPAVDGKWVTSVVNISAANSTFDKCYFYYEGARAGPKTIYLLGPNNVVKNSYIQSSEGGYVYGIEAKSTTQQATYINNFDYNTKAPIVL